MSHQTYQKFLDNMHRTTLIEPCLDESQYVITSFRKNTSDPRYYRASTKALALVSIVRNRLVAKYGKKISDWESIGSAYGACPSIFVAMIASPRSLQKRNKFYENLDKRLSVTKGRFPKQ
jgi:5-bromo-4-chloroindolyl phosphate hydrolysis protein